jgi:hypothetical protein
VITLVDWRRAWVAPEGAIVAAWLLEASWVFRLAGSGDPALRIVLDHAGATAVVTVCPRRSFPGVARLGVGDAAVPLYLRGVQRSLCCSAAEGLFWCVCGAVSRGCWLPRVIGVAWVGLPGPLIWVDCGVTECEVGTGTGVLLDQLLAGAGIALTRWLVAGLGSIWRLLWWWP